MFEKIVQDYQNYAAEHKVEMVKIITSNSNVFNRSVLVQTINNIPYMTDEELRRFIQYNINLIFSMIFNQNYMTTDYVKLFYDVRFIDAFIDVLSGMQYLERVIKCNTICYDYISSPNRDPIIEQRMITLSRVINRNCLPRLLGLGCSDTLANILSIARNSSLNMDVCIKRVDFIIITQSKEFMNQSNIEQIIRILFNVDKEFDKIFQYFMFDVLPEYNENDPSTTWITDDIEEVNSTMNLAILDILDSLPMPIIRNVILNYAEGYSLIGANRKVRFSMRKLAEYYRINNAVYDLSYEGIFIP